MSQSPTAVPHEHQAALKNPDGTWKYTNRLIDESSPYLLQHAHNPVAWYAWGPDAFDAARKTGKPIFLSIGYSTCYWCHVMERQCFENPTIAALMNDHFICIKVDREERPDVDDIYMTAVQAMAGRGGWPMSVFLTPPGADGQADPGLRPFYAGTYFPPTPTQGMPGFPQVLLALADAWRNKRAQVIGQSNRIADAVREHTGRRDAGGELSADLVQHAFNRIMQTYDAIHGGFGGAPKFPQPNVLAFLIRVQESNPDDNLHVAITHTLDRMARGGMFDQVGGGFHRYSTDEKWLVPHFEKMLYDNGQLLEIYCRAQQIMPFDADADFHPRVIRRVCDYVLREMRDDSGTFWSAQDAEVDAREGGNYVWTDDQVREALAPLNDDKLVTLALAMYGLDKGTNFQDPHHQDEPPTNVLYLPAPLHELASQRGMTMAQLLAAKRKTDAQLFAVRSERDQPMTDDKVLVSWNGMMIAGLAAAGRTLDEPRYTAAAGQAADYILAHLRDESDGLYRTMRRGKAKIPAFLEDYAFFIHGLIELHRADGDRKWRDAAVKLADVAARRFGAPQGGYYDTLADQADLFVRTRSFHDGALSSPNSQMAHNLLDLHEITDRANYRDDAIRLLHSFAGTLQSHGPAMPHMQHALLRALETAPAKVAAPPVAAPQPFDAVAPPVTAEVEPQQVDLSTGSAVVRVTLRIGKDYHINANKPGPDFLVPTTLALENAAGLELSVTYPEGESRKYPFADEPLSVYEGAIVLEAVIRQAGDAPANAPADAKPKLIVHYQACTAGTCLQPARIELPLTLK